MYIIIRIQTLSIPSSSSEFFRFASSATPQIIQTLSSSTPEFRVSVPSATPPHLLFLK